MWQVLAGRRARSRPWRWRDETGASAVEFAVVLPMLALLALGIVDFGSLFGNWSSLRQGTWTGARAASLADFTSVAGCTLTFSGGGLAPSQDLQNVMCLAKQQINEPESSVRVDVVISDLAMANTGVPWAVGGNLTVCTQVPAASTTGFLAWALHGHYLRTKATIRIEADSPNNETQGYETDPSGAGWSWCTPQGASP